MAEGRRIDVEVVLAAPPGRYGEQSFGIVRFLAPAVSSTGGLAIAEIGRDTMSGATTTADSSRTVPIPVGLDPESALLIPLLATALAVWNQLELEMGEAAVFSSGESLSGFLAQTALWHGASPILMIGSLQSIQLPPGITAIEAESSDEVVQAVKAATARSPGWAAVETTGRPEILDVILDAVPKWGRIALCGGATSAATVDFYNNVHRKGVRLNASVLSPSAVFAQPHAQRLTTFTSRAARLLSHPAVAHSVRQWAI